MTVNRKGKAGKNKNTETKKQTHTYTRPQGVDQLTEISRIVIRRTVEAQVLQIRDEVRDCALVYALTLTEDVQLVDKQHRYRRIN